MAVKYLYLTGMASFLLFVINDINQIRDNKLVFRLLFPAGAAILCYVSVKIGIIWGSPASLGSLRSLAAVGALLSGMLMIYALFFAIPAGEAYLKGSGQELCTSGLYGICRHPGVWGFGGIYFFSSIWLKSAEVLYAGLIFTACNIAYSWFQDKKIFPLLFEGYDDYRKTVPFLIPGTGSSKKQDGNSR